MVRPRVHASLPWVAAVLLYWTVGAAQLPAQDTATTVALRHVEANHQALGLTRSDVSDLTVNSVSISRHNGTSHVYLQQRYRGIDVRNGVLTVSVRGGSVLSVGNRFVANIAAAADAEPLFRKEAPEALDHAEVHLNLPRIAPIYILAQHGGASDATTMEDGASPTTRSTPS